VRIDAQPFWTPPRPGEKILGMCTYRDVVVVATTDGVYVIRGPGSVGLDDCEVTLLEPALYVEKR
jgi:hypothetical protein